MLISPVMKPSKFNGTPLQKFQSVGHYLLCKMENRNHFYSHSKHYKYSLLTFQTLHQYVMFVYFSNKIHFRLGLGAYCHLLLHTFNKKSVKLIASKGGVWLRQREVVTSPNIFWKKIHIFCQKIIYIYIYIVTLDQVKTGREKRGNWYSKNKGRSIEHSAFRCQVCPPPPTSFFFVMFIFLLHIL